jgi:hypothetical protein
LLRYVDDLFGAFFTSCSLRTRDMLIEIVGLLGLRLDPDKTPTPSSTMLVLGVVITIVRVQGLVFALLSIDPAKNAVWLRDLRTSHHTGRLSPPQAEVMAGRLEFAASAVLGKGHRHRIRTLYDHARQHHYDISTNHLLLDDINWWISLLSSHTLSRRVQVTGDLAPPWLLYTDAEGKGGIGAVLFPPVSTTPSQWFADTCPKDITASFHHRKTQIVPLEALAVLVAILHFSDLIKGSRLIIMVDNTSVVGALLKGSSRKPDINHIIGCTLMTAHARDIEVFVHWVPSRFNVADLPSRGKPPAISGGPRIYLDWALVRHHL